jgi:hypothetical protein
VLAVWTEVHICLVKVADVTMVDLQDSSLLLNLLAPCFNHFMFVWLHGLLSYNGGTPSISDDNSFDDLFS